MSNDFYKKAENLGLVPVVVINDASKAVPLAKAVFEGGINCVEITFRTDAAEESISLIHKALPDMILGAGTVVSVEQAEKAVAAGAQFIVSPGIDPEIVLWCRNRDIPVIPGVCTPSEVQQGVKLGLDVLKFFPAEASGGVAMVKNLCGPFPKVRFMATGGISMANLGEYASCPNILAAGGSWMVKSDLIQNEKWTEITGLCSEALKAVQGFEMIHMGINTASPEDAAEAAGRFEAFGMEANVGNSSTFMNSSIELMHKKFRGTNGHIGYRCCNVERALSYLAGKGFTPAEETIKRDEKGRIKVVYLNEEVGGFAIHLVRK